jgi:hypothetical protein
MPHEEIVDSLAGFFGGNGAQADRALGARALRGIRKFCFHLDYHTLSDDLRY